MFKKPKSLNKGRNQCWAANQYKYKKVLHTLLKHPYKLNILIIEKKQFLIYRTINYIEKIKYLQFSDL